LLIFLFFFFFDATVENARVLFSKATSTKPATRDFRFMLIEELETQLTIEENPFLDDARSHTPSRLEVEGNGRRRRRRCVNCYEDNQRESRSTYFCSKCDAGLCFPECFQEYHRKRFKEGAS